MKKDRTNIKILLGTLIATLVSSLVSVAATGNLFDSNEVVYDNTSSGMNSSNVKNAVDELYAAANDYSNINSRVTTLESHFLDNATSVFYNHDIRVGYNEPTNGNAFVDFYSKGLNRGAVGVDPSGNTILMSKSTTGTQGGAPLSILGNPVNIKGQTVTVNGYNAVTTATVSWGTKMSFKMASGSHALLCISNTQVYLLWAAGSTGNVGVNVIRIYGSSDPAGFGVSIDNDTNITVKLASNNTITAFFSRSLP